MTIQPKKLPMKPKRRSMITSVAEKQSKSLLDSNGGEFRQRRKTHKMGNDPNQSLIASFNAAFGSSFFNDNDCERLTLTAPLIELDRDSPRPSPDFERMSVLYDDVRHTIASVGSQLENSLIRALNVPKEPTPALGPSREFHEKHGLTFINNLMGLSCLFFLTLPLTVAIEYSSLKEQSSTTIWLMVTISICATIQTIFSISGDYWYTRRSPESDNFWLDRATRWIFGKREGLVVTGPYHTETWKRLYYCTTLDVSMAHVCFAMHVAFLSWQFTHGAPVGLSILLTVLAGSCKVIGGLFWRGMNESSYNPRKIWWYNFFHFYWHLLINVALYVVAQDACRNGMRKL